MKHLLLTLALTAPMSLIAMQAEKPANESIYAQAEAYIAHPETAYLGDIISIRASLRPDASFSSDPETKKRAQMIVEKLDKLFDKKMAEIDKSFELKATESAYDQAETLIKHPESARIKDIMDILPALNSDASISSDPATKKRAQIIVEKLDKLLDEKIAEIRNR